MYFFSSLKNQNHTGITPSNQNLSGGIPRIIKEV
jgi:hypothetical protein